MNWSGGINPALSLHFRGMILSEKSATFWCTDLRFQDHGLDTASDALVSPAPEPLDKDRQIVVEPFLQHRPQHLLGHFVERLVGALREGLRELPEGSGDLTTRNRGDDGLCHRLQAG